MKFYPSATLVLLLTPFLSACAANQQGSTIPQGTATSSGKPVVALRGSLLTWDDLHPALAEAAGAVAIEEAVLDLALASQVSQRFLVIDEHSIATERESLARAMESDAGMSPEQASVQLDRVRRARGLGPARFEALLLRNARLRALVRADAVADITPTPEQLTQEDRIVNGERCRVRVLFTPSQATCSRVRDAVLDAVAGTPTPQVLSARFADAAMRESTDLSARAGGLLESVSAADPAIPESIRLALTTMKPGEVSPVLVSGKGFALVLMESRAQASRVIPRDELENRLHTRLERLAMERLARELVATSSVSVLDPSLAWAWENR